MSSLRQFWFSKLSYSGCLQLTGKTSSRLPVPKYCPFLKLMKQPILLSDSPTAFSQNTLLVSTEMYLQVALLCRPVVTVWTLEGLLTGVCAHVKGKDAVEAEAFSTQWARVLPVLAVIILGGINLGDDALIGDSQELGKLCSPIHTAENSCIHYLIGQESHLALNWVDGRGNKADWLLLQYGDHGCRSEKSRGDHSVLTSGLLNCDRMWSHAVWMKSLLDVSQT